MNGMKRVILLIGRRKQCECLCANIKAGTCRYVHMTSKQRRIKVNAIS